MMTEADEKNIVKGLCRNIEVYAKSVIEIVRNGYIHGELLNSEKVALDDTLSEMQAFSNTLHEFIKYDNPELVEGGTT